MPPWKWPQSALRRAPVRFSANSSRRARAFSACCTRRVWGLPIHYLAGTDFSHSEIAYLLGFTDPNSFFRAYQSWTQSTPEQAWQRALLKLWLPCGFLLALTGVATAGQGKLHP